jgi:hypothetical protein
MSTTKTVGQFTVRTHITFPQIVATLAEVIERGDVTPAPGELEALLVMCEKRKLTTEAQRIRRWLGLA